MREAEGLVKGRCANDRENAYTLLYYSLSRRGDDMPGPNGGNFRREVLKVPDRAFWGRQAVIDKVFLPAFFRKNKINIFHRAVGYTMPEVKNVYKILTVHDLRTLTIGDRWAEQNIGHYQKVFSVIDCCVVVSECTKRDLIEHFGINEQKIKVIYLGVDDRYCILEREKVTRVVSKFGITQPYFLSVGSVPRKNIPGIIRGFSKSKFKNEYKLVLNCYMEVDKYKILCRELGIEHQVIFINSVSDEDLVALFNGCHCFIFPSLYEGFGLPILEAMKCGAPVITSNISACPEVAGAAAILVDPKNTEQIGDALNQVCGDKLLRKNLIEKGFEQAQKFSWDNFAREMKRIYTSA